MCAKKTTKCVPNVSQKLPQRPNVSQKNANCVHIAKHILKTQNQGFALIKALP